MRPAATKARNGGPNACERIGALAMTIFRHRAWRLVSTVISPSFSRSAALSGAVQWARYSSKPACRAAHCVRRSLSFRPESRRLLHRAGSVAGEPIECEKRTSDEMPKPLRFDSGAVGPMDAEEVWREALRPIYELQRSKTEFEALIHTWSLDGRMLLTRHFTKDEVWFKRTRRRIATSGVEHYLVHCLLGGSLASELKARNSGSRLIRSLCATQAWRTSASP